jgi:hypothetical protein
MICLESFFELPKNKRVLRLQNIAPLDKLPKTQAVHIGSAPLHCYLFLAIWRLGLAALEKVYWEDSQKKQDAVTI